MKPELQDLFIAADVFRKLGLKRIGVFGSYARDERYNDIDLFLEEDPGYTKREFLKDLIEKNLHKECDIVIKGKVEPIIQYYINKDLKYVESC